MAKQKKKLTKFFARPATPDSDEELPLLPVEAPKKRVKKAAKKDSSKNGSSNDSAASMVARFPFLELPPELRNLVYKCCIPSTPLLCEELQEPYHQGHEHYWAPNLASKSTPTLFLVCRTIYLEFSAAFFHDAVLSLSFGKYHKVDWKTTIAGTADKILNSRIGQRGTTANRLRTELTVLKSEVSRFRCFLLRFDGRGFPNEADKAFQTMVKLVDVSNSHHTPSIAVRLGDMFQYLWRPFILGSSHWSRPYRFILGDHHINCFLEGVKKAVESSPASFSFHYDSRVGPNNKLSEELLSDFQGQCEGIGATLTGSD